MCFSAEADLVAGVSVAAVGLLGARHVQARAEVALAALPVVLGLHLLVEAAVWRGLEGHLATETWRPAMWLYLGIAFGVVPVLAPLAAVALEPPGRRRRLAPFVGLGAAVAVVLVGALLTNPVRARIDGHHIAYDVTFRYGGIMVGLYVLATCLPALLSLDRGVRVFGWCNLAAVGVLVAFERNGLTSLWCAWAAVTSVVIVRRLRSARPAGGLQPEAANLFSP